MQAKLYFHLTLFLFITLPTFLSAAAVVPESETAVADPASYRGCLPLFLNLGARHRILNAQTRRFCEEGCSFEAVRKALLGAPRLRRGRIVVKILKFQKDWNEAFLYRQIWDKYEPAKKTEIICTFVRALGLFDPPSWESAFREAYSLMSGLPRLGAYRHSVERAAVFLEGFALSEADRECRDLFEKFAHSLPVSGGDEKYLKKYEELVRLVNGMPPARRKIAMETYCLRDPAIKAEEEKTFFVTCLPRPGEDLGPSIEELMLIKKREKRGKRGKKRDGGKKIEKKK